MEIQSEIRQIIINQLSSEQRIIVCEKETDRSFPIIIGIWEAMMLDCAIKGLQPPRPMTHNLIVNTIEALGGEVERFVISDISDHIFIGTLVLRNSRGPVEIDCRPSDGLVIATLKRTPIFVEERVFDKAC